MTEDLRRITRVCVCCRVVVRDRYGVWTAVTEDVSARGCQLVTTRLLRCGTVLDLTLSSDLFSGELHVGGEVVWTTPTRLGVAFVRTRDGHRLTPAAWVEKVIAHGEIPGSSSKDRVVPCVMPAASRTVVRKIRRA